MVLLPILISIVAGLALLVSKASGAKKIHSFAGIVMAVSALLTIFLAVKGVGEFVLFTMFDELPIFFHVDATGGFFAIVTAVIWTAICFYSFKYMEHEGGEKRFYGFYLIVYGVLIAIDFSGNLVTLYFFYELMTLTSMPMILHGRTKESIMAALKYLFYSMAGAYLALFGLYFLYQNCESLTFVAGGTLTAQAIETNGKWLLVVVFCMMVGFGAKAGMFPLHAWLPTAHPAAPAPASAALSAVLVKSGVLAIVRVVYYVVGADFLRGSWVQTVWMSLTLLTVFMGSMLAYREKVFKKRLAYSTVSQVSYILFGLSLLTEQGFTGAMLQVAAHALAKCALFMTAGIFILRTGKICVEDYKGYGKTMRVTLWGYTFAALSLIGIPPTIGFVTKWYLAEGALGSGSSLFGILGPVVLLASALLTAGYLLPITMKGFFPGEDTGMEAQKEQVDRMTVVLVFVAFAALLLGLFPGGLLSVISRIAATLFV